MKLRGTVCNAATAQLTNKALMTETMMLGTLDIIVQDI